MAPDQFSRRAFLQALARTAQGSAVVLTLPAILSACKEANEARGAGADLLNLTDEEADTLRAIASRIMPTDETPGAEEAGVIYFLDQVLASPRHGEPVRAGLAGFTAQVRAVHGNAVFHQLGTAEQDALLGSIESSDFFQTMRFLTMAGMFCLPEYGGNRNLSGYDMIGFDNRHAWAPPFGYYDQQQEDV